jgi:hypothetical protein
VKENESEESQRKHLASGLYELYGPMIKSRLYILVLVYHNPRPERLNFGLRLLCLRIYSSGSEVQKSAHEVKRKEWTYIATALNSC